MNLSFKKVLSMILAIVMIVGMMPANIVFATEADTENSGTVESTVDVDVTDTTSDDSDGTVEDCDFTDATADELEVATKADLAAAIAAAQDGDTIKLTANIDYGTDHLKIEKAITLDLGGYTLTTGARNYGLALYNGCTVTNGKLVHAGTVAAIKVWDAVEISDLEIDVTGTSASGNTIDGIVIQENAAGVDTIKNVKIYSTAGQGVDSGIKTFNCGNAASPVIGAMENVTVDAKTVGLNISAPCGTATGCTIKGGVSGIDMLLKGTYSASLTLVDCDVTGGTQAVYAHDEQKGYTYDGSLTLTADADTTFESTSGVLLTQLTEEDTEVTLPSALVDGAVAKVNGAYYKSFKDAVAAANAIEGGATVTLLADVTLGEKLTISGNVTISGAYTITRADDYTGTLFTVNVGATLTLDGGLTIDGGNNYAFNSELYNANLEAMVSIPKTDAEKYFTPEAGAPVATAYMIVLTKGTSADAFGGTVNLNNVTIQNNYSINSGIVSAAQYTKTNLNGAKITHVASTQGNGVAVNASGAGIQVNMNEGTVIDGNHVGGNHGIFKVYSGAVFTMNGGEVKNTTGWNSNGNVVGLYAGTFIMNGGTICSNSSVYGPSNGRNAAIYLHSNSVMEMNGGTICHNTGRSRGGIDSSKTSSKLTITGGEVLDNISLAGNSTADIGGTTGTWEITGGTFTQDVTEWLAPDSGLVYNEVTGTYGLTEDLYEYGGVKFQTLAELIAAIKNAPTTYSSEAPVVTVLASHKIDETVVIDIALTLNLNGKTITTAATAAGTYVDALTILAEVTVTGEGKIDARPSHGYTFYIGDTDGNAGNLTIENGTFYGESSVVNNRLGTVTINGGNFAISLENEDDTYDFVLNCIDANYTAGTAKIVVKGGTFYKFNPAANAAEGEETNFVAEGYISEETKTDYFTVRELNYVALVGDVKYESLQEAINACANGETVKLIADITYDADDIVYAHGGATGFGNYDQYNPCVLYIGGTKGETAAENQPSNVNAVLDLNGHTITSTANAYMFIIMDNAKLTIKDSVGTGAMINEDANYPVIWAVGTDTLVTIESGKYQTDSIYGLLHVTHSGDMVITGGEFSTTADDASLLIMLNSQPYNNPNYFLSGVATVTISGGTFKGFNPAQVGDDYGASSVADIKFVDGCALGYEPKDNGDGTYGVQPWDLEIWNKADLELFNALAQQYSADGKNPFEGETVKLMANIDFDWGEWKPVTFYGTFEGNNYTISNLTYVTKSATGTQMGFFNSLSGTAKNFTIDGVKATLVEGGKLGGVARLLNGYCENVHIKNITVDVPGKIDWFIGGFAGFAYGYANNCSVENFTLNAPNATGEPCIGGFIGSIRNNATFTNCDVKGFKATVSCTDGLGIAGFAPHTQTGWQAPNFVDCDVTGIDFVISGLADVAGFVTWPGAHTDATNCTTQGKIDVTGVTSDGCFAGGFFGNLGWNCDLGQMGHVLTDCSADVDIITKLADAGGFVGSATNSNNRSMYATFNNCSASGDITCVEGGTADIGGFFGEGDRGVYNNCTASGTVTNNGTGYAGQFGGALYDVTPSYDHRYPAGTRDYLVDEITLDNCSATGTATSGMFIGNIADGVNLTIKSYVAQIGENYYYTIQDALAAANDGDVVTLLKDVTIYDEITFGNADADLNVTLDLNGKTVTGYNVYPVIRVQNGETLTVKNGTITNADYVFVLGASDGSSVGNLTIESGSYIGNVTVASVTKGTLTILGGDFSVTESDYGATYLLNCIDANYKDGSAAIVVKGGTFHNFDPANNAAEGTGTDFVHVEYVSTENNGVWTVAEWDYEIWTKADLVKLDKIVESGNMLEGVTVKLMADIDLYEMGEGGEPVTFNPIGANNAYFKGTFDGQGHTIKNMYQSGWALGYDWYNYGSIGLFAYLWDATVKNLTIENAECLVEGGNVGAIAGCAWGDVTFENITVKNSTFATYNNRAGGIVGWTGGEGTFTFKNITVDEDTVIAGLWGSFDSSLGGIMGQLQSDSKAVFENVDVACRLDAYNDVTASYKYYAYRMCGMLIGKIAVDENNQPILTNVTIGENVNVTFGDWAHYTYLWDDSLSRGCQRVEAGYAYGGIDVTQYPDADITSLSFKSLFGGQQYGSYGQAEHEDVEVEFVAYAAIGETEYWSLADALAAAKAGDVVKLLKDVTLYDEITFSGTSVTLDLNGKTVTGYNVYPVIRVQNDGDLTVKNGTITNDDYVFVLGASDGSSAGYLTIESGKYHGETTVASVTKGTLTITGGEFSVDPYNGSYEYLLNCIDANYADGSAAIVVKGGTFHSFNPKANAAEGAETNFVADGYGVEVKENQYTVKPVITVTFDSVTMIHGNAVPEFTYTTNFTDVAEDGTMLVVETPVVNVTGAGEYEITANAYVFMNDDYIVEVVPGTLTVTAAAAKIGDVYYATLAEAIEAVKDGETIVLLMANNESVTIKQQAGLSFTIDGNDKTYTGTITVNGNKRSTGAETLTIQNLNFVLSTNKQIGIFAKEGTYAHNITVDGCTFTGTEGVTTYGMKLANAYNITVKNTTGTKLFELVYSNKAVTGFTAENVTVTESTYGFFLSYVMNASFKNVTVNATSAGIAVNNFNSSTVTIKDCNLTAKWPVYLQSKSSTNAYTLIFDGTNTMTPTTDGDAWLYVEKSDAMFKVVVNDESLDMTKTSGLAAKIGNVYYNTLQNAINDAADGATIELFKNIELNESSIKHEPVFGYETLLLVDGKSITIDFAGYVVTVKHGSADKYDAGVGSCLEAVVFVNEGAGLTLTDSTGANGGFHVPADDNVSVYSLVYNCGGTLTIENGTYTVVKGHAAASIIYAEGNHQTTVNGGIFTMGNAGENDNTKPWIFNTEGKNETFITVTGGIYNQNPYLNYGTSKDCEVTVSSDKVFVQITKGDYAGYWKLADAVAMNVEKELGYATLTEALNDADSGETVKLLVNTLSESVLMVPANVTLDLNGNTIEVTYAVLGFGHVIDTAETTGGIKISTDVQTSRTSLLPNNEYLPIYDTVTGCYKFYEYELRVLGTKFLSSNTKLTFGYQLWFENIEAYQVIGRTDYTAINLKVTLTWEGRTGADIVYTFTDGLVKEYAAEMYARATNEEHPKYGNLRAATNFTISGLDKLESGTMLEATLSVVSATGVESAKETDKIATP